MTKTTVTFDSAGIPLAGHLYSPDTAGVPGPGPRSSSVTPAPA